MASKVLEFFVFSTMLHLITKLTIMTKAQQVPCLFLIGDSIFDNGDNNVLFSLAKANYLPYGVDFSDGPTGRLNNGKIIPDFIAELLGFEQPIPPFVTAKGDEILKGVNYASAGAGILESSGTYQGARFTMSLQLLNHETTISKVALVLGNATLAEEHLNKCLYMVNMGSNEYVSNYLLPPLYLSSLFYTPQQFATIATKRYSQLLRSLYKYGARKVVVYELGLLGCMPRYLKKDGTDKLICDDSINKVVQLFNHRLKPMIDNLNADLHAARCTLTPYTTLGIKFRNASCCMVSVTGLCEAGKQICKNRNDYFYFDDYHYSEIVCGAFAGRSYDAQSPHDAYPTDIRRLVS